MDHQEFIRILSASLCLLSISEFAIGADTLSPNQTLADGQVLSSPGQIFELGFFSRRGNSSRFLGIWFNATPDVIVWVANRNNPITATSQGVLSLAENGMLVLSTATRPDIWSSNSSRAVSSPALQLLDTGNLVIADTATASQGGYIWQSFDHPCDTSLPGMKIVQNPDTGESKYLTSWRSADDPASGRYSYRIENQGVSQLIVMDDMKKISRVVFWNGYFNSFTNLNDPSWSIEAETKRGRLISIFHPFYENISTRVTMNYSGSLQRFIMNEQKNGWTLMWSVPSNLCESYGTCGYNGICTNSKSRICDCLRGFSPKSEMEWNLYNWQNGCTRNQSLDCQKEDGFLKMEGVRFPDSLGFRLNISMTIDECRDECLKNCNCTAYADPFFSNGSSCLMWFGDLIDMKEQFGNSINPKPTLYLRVPLFSLAAIAAATNNFSDENMIGEGGFGPMAEEALTFSEIGVSFD